MNIQPKRVGRLKRLWRGLVTGVILGIILWVPATILYYLVLR